MSLDTQTTLRLAVSQRLEKVLKVDHLTTNPLKAEREDFIPPLVLKRIEDAAPTSSTCSAVRGITSACGLGRGDPERVRSRH